MKGACVVEHVQVHAVVGLGIADHGRIHGVVRDVLPQPGQRAGSQVNPEVEAVEKEITAGPIPWSQPAAGGVEDEQFHGPSHTAGRQGGGGEGATRSWPH